MVKEHDQNVRANVLYAHLDAQGREPNANFG
jgi:hypothetical protein